MILNLNVERDGLDHDAEADAVNTMLCLKRISKNLETNTLDIISICPECIDLCENFNVKSLIESQIKNVNKFNQTLYENKDNIKKK